MAVRGVASFLIIYPELTPSGTDPLYLFQNYFPEPTSDGFDTYDYKAFTVSTLIDDKNSTSHDFTLTFPATAENVDLVEECLINRYDITVLIYRWSDTEGLEAPTTFNFFAGADGSALSATADITTVTLLCRPYADAIDGDIPWQKISWTILGPLSLGS
jgi:hypothetical protein